ncbi:B3 domain-containing protein Os07g0183300/Os07g0183600-like isoform X2 [Oryza brachyantha]|uniref:B3 domain-containing protein Os07g0183300/Os07g0183600-like isoform X2 n=1 Tax=Oryza brachyantha TaxID=4533 RepID=UPI000776727D|nr:B3 domain-containing protein Os07g0183300/Os07g0183600-like isoform X2 [Oryza brachyantha]
MWLACANPKSGRLPAVGSLVYYFPHGHTEQCPSPLAEPLACPHVFLCRVVAVRFSANIETNEPYAAISLKPGVLPNDDVPRQHPHPAPVPDHQQPQIYYFVKELNDKDADHRVLFTAPMDVANKVFPPPLENQQTRDLSVRDLQGVRMYFNYRGNGRRVEFRKGWRRFHKDMDLIDGDHVIFMRRPASDQVFLGVRRQRDVPKTVRVTTTVTLQEVMEAVRLAAEGVEFTVNYYSRQDGDEFVVPREVVDEALRARLTPAMAWSSHGQSRTARRPSLAHRAMSSTSSPRACGAISMYPPIR